MLELTKVGLAVRRRAGVAAVAVGVLIGVSAFTFRYAEGFSYFSKDPAACANCHIMQSQYDSWQKSSHHGVATCVDCHLPHGLIEKYIAKAENGYFHSKGFTLQDFPEPIVIKDKNYKILQNNCLSCHGDLVHELVPGATMDVDSIRCTHCHSTVGHGERAGLGGPQRVNEMGGER
ncbi:MAG: cytochrome c nitrite reductase small subunit [Verrucomicrobia bacterium]|nr:cytochrome c nitrite reductase small subunit [Verrucomicrobiota bacterium]